LHLSEAVGVRIQQKVRCRSTEYRKRVRCMLIVTTIYTMEIETAKKLSAQEPGEGNAEAKVPMDDWEFLGIY